MRALVLSGGGSRGAFQLGILRYLVDTENVDYSIYAGVSVGAINASVLATGPTSETLTELEQMWFQDIKGARSIYTHLLWHKIFRDICVIVFFLIAAFILFALESPKLLTLFL